MTIEIGRTYIFTKSGNEVRAIELLPPRRGSGDSKQWVVERTRGTSKGKRMIVNERALEERS